MVVFIPGMQPLFAEGPPAPSALDNPLVVGFIILMAILLLIIGILANLLLNVAQVKMAKEKKQGADAKLIVPIILFLAVVSNPLMAQNNTAASAATATTAASIAGISTTAFYLMVSVIFLELLVVLVLLMNVRVLLRAEKAAVEKIPAPSVWKARSINLWKRLNSFKPVEQEADIDLGHDYDGIRELDNRLPPWWLYGFYITILVAGIYLYRFHVSHTGPTAVQEYETAIAKADIQIKEYIKQKGDQVDENTVTFLTAPEEIEAGKIIFSKSCVACHSEGGAGSVGPNLTDEYWLHGGDSFSNKQIAELASYVKSLKGTKPANPKAPQGVLYNEEGGGEKTNTPDSSKAISKIKSQ
jgi:cytochrome c oxidase cbb3-type subunit 3